MGPASRRYLDAVRLDVVADELRGREAARNVHPIIVTTQQQVVSKKELLDRAVRFDRSRKERAQAAPGLACLLPGLCLFRMDALGRQDKRRREIGPQRFAVEVGVVQWVPWR